MTDVEDILAGARSFLAVDWPTRDVPDSLARAGYDVVGARGAGAGAAGLTYLDEPYIAGAVRSRG